MLGIPIIRPFIDDDAGQCAEIFTLAGRAAFFWAQWPDMDEKTLYHALADEAVFVGELNGQVKGFIALYLPDKFIHHLYIHPDAQGSGIGRALLDFAQAVLGPGAHLKCQMRNSRARAFYSVRHWVEDRDSIGCDEIGPWIRIYYPGS
jgi:GNAT superfamily N-acetyltransferase